jgi:hypothetical protein
LGSQASCQVMTLTSFPLGRPGVRQVLGSMCLDAGYQRVVLVSGSQATTESPFQGVYRLGGSGVKINPLLA